MEVTMNHKPRWLVLVIFCCLAFSMPSARAESDSTGESRFPLLPGLEKPVEFWKKIFTEYSVSQLVFFDPADMSKVYEVIDVGPENRSDGYIEGERTRIAAENNVEVSQVKAQRGIKERTAAGLKRSGRYIAEMQRIFRDRGLPIELTYLPLLESSYDISARSYVGALGMWQFMPATGKQFLRVDKAIDERRDPLESTRAAAAFLKQAYDALGSWPLAITSYNYGPAGVARAVAEIGSDNLVELIQKYNHPYWGYAPKNFYAEFLVAVDIGKNVNQYFPELELDAPRGIKEVELRGRTSLSSLVNSSGMTHGQFLDWNPALTSKTKFIPAGYRVKLPTQKTMEPVVQVAQEKSQPEPQRPQVIRHRVQRGETLVQIARRYGASAERILHINGMRRASAIRAGTTLLVPKL
jgi:membrane-bound lytic murein transglycosylase D